MHLHREHSDPKRGGALLAAVVLVALLAALAAAALTSSTSSSMEMSVARDRVRSLYAAEAGLNEALTELRTSETLGTPPAAALGTANAPIELSQGSYYSTITDNLDGTFTVLSVGRAGLRERALESTVARVGGGIFDNAIFAGNSSGDPAYELELGGVGGQADSIDGNVYSGGDLTISDDADVTGAASASGGVAGNSGDGTSGGVAQPVPDIAGMAYELNNDYDVGALFAGAEWKSDDAGGRAWQVPESNPAHIFRRDPNDRQTEIDNTDKVDYFLEDPYETVRRDRDWDGTDAFEITLTGDATDKTFFIDGNLWIHNNPTYSFKFTNSSGDPIRLTFVVKGNIVFSDNLFYQNEATDGVVFMAMEDENVPDSGNIYFGDPRGGTIETMYGFMYAENDFVDMNLSASGSKNVIVNGNMTAGNHVSLNRNYMKNGVEQHSRLEVNFDDRISSGALTLPSLPSWAGSAAGFQVVSWREVAAP
tara:strand:+ start:14987 stop:16426 length:1440 start_codon:yes stop_codon:yes gene_type:complete